MTRTGFLPRIMLAELLEGRNTFRPTSCDRLDDPNAKCACTYPGCSKNNKCCKCLHYHLSMRQLPACCFPPDVEKTYDRSFAAFIACHSK